MSGRNGGVGRDSEITADTCLAGATSLMFFESFAVSKGRGGIAHPFFATASPSNTLPTQEDCETQPVCSLPANLSHIFLPGQLRYVSPLPPSNFSPSPHPDFSLFMMISCPVRSQGSRRERKGGQITLQQQISSPGLCERECLADRSAGRYTSYQRHEDRLLFSTGPRPRRQEKTGHEQQGWVTCPSLSECARLCKCCSISRKKKIEESGVNYDVPRATMRSSG